MGYNAEMLSERHAKAAQICQADNCFVDDMERFACHGSSLIRQSYHSATNLDPVLPQKFL